MTEAAPPPTGRVWLSPEGTLARVTLSNPGKLNAMTRTMWRELRQVFDALRGASASNTFKLVLVQGAQGNFCAGGDISEYPDFRFDEAALREFHEGDVWGGLSAMLRCDLPVLAQIEGACMGAGMEIASACDIRVASASAKFGASIAKLGFPMAPREAALVAGAAGVLTANEMLLEAAVLTAQYMHLRGFLNKVVEAAALEAEVAARVHRMQGLAPKAAGLNKQTFRTLVASPDVLDANWVHASYHFADTAEHREGIAAFLEKRKPEF